MELMGCKGMVLGSGLLADPCQFCQRRSDAGDMLPAVKWVDLADAAGYQCTNQVKRPKPKHRSEVWASLVDECLPQTLG